MKIVNDFPPNFEEIDEVFHPTEGVVFTYGDTLYSPHRSYISEDLMAHEATHMRQQAKNPQGWWSKYLVDPKFRVEQEVAAYQNQYLKFKEDHRDRNNQARFLHKLALDLSGPMYGNVITYHEAIIAIMTLKN